MWTIYQDRNAWLAGQALATAETMEAAKAKADELGARYVEGGPDKRTYFRWPYHPAWRPV